MDDDERIRRLLVNTSDGTRRIPGRLAHREFSPHDRHLVPRLKEILASSDTHRARCVALVLGKIGGAEALDTLLSLIASKDLETCCVGLTGLFEFVPESDRQTSALLAAVDRVIESDDDFLSCIAIRGSGSFRTEASPALVQAASRPHSAVRIEARTEILRLRCESGDLVAAVDEALAAYAKSPSSTEGRRLCDCALDHLVRRGPAAADAARSVIACLRLSTPLRRVDVLKTLVSIAPYDPRVRVAIAEAVDDPDTTIRLAAIECARKLGAALRAEAEPALTRALLVRNPLVRKAAAEALQAVRPPNA